MWLLTPKISCTTTRPPRGAPAGSARQAASRNPSAAVSSIICPIARSSVGTGRIWYADCRIPFAMPPTPSSVQVRSRLPATGTSIFSVMSALAQQHGAVNLGQGFPDYAIDPVLIDLVGAAMRAGHNQYPLMPGVMALREAIAGKVERLYGHAYDPEHEVTVTTGATQAIFTTIGALAHPGDEVIVFEPAYDSYIPAVRLAGATPVPLPLTVPGYRIDWAARARRDHAAHAD